MLTIDPENRQTKKIYDAASQVIEDRRGVGTANEQAYATFAYTLNGKQAWIKDAKGNQTTYDYDGYDRSTKTTFPDATYEELAYTIVDTVASKRTRGNQLIVNTYDVMDRLVTHLVPQPGATPAILTSTAYDAAGRPTSISDNTGHSLVYELDSAKRVISVTQAAPTFSGTRVVSYTFDPAGNKTRTTWADGYYVQYAYDGLNRMTTATENGTFLLATYIYDPLSRRTSLVYGNGASQGYTYSTQGDLLTLASTLTGTSNTTTNTFSKAHQLASEATSNAAWGYLPAAFQTTNYAAANLLNQYVNITVGANPTVTLTYDASGNLTGDGTWTLAFDAANVMRSSTKAGMSVTYVYDPIGRRQAKIANGATTSFLHDRDDEIAEYVGAALERRYIPGPVTDTPIAMVTPSGASNTHVYFHANRQGSTIAMSTDDGTMSEGPYTYDASGNGAPTTGVPFKYTGRRLDPETGFYFYRARYYSANLGRFLQTDAIGYRDQMNLYAYVRNDPLNLVDPSGDCSKVYDPSSRTWSEVGLCGNDQAAIDLINSVNAPNARGQKFDELRELDREASLRGVRVGVNVVNDGSGSRFVADDPLAAMDGRGSGGTITIDMSRSFEIEVITVRDAVGNNRHRTAIHPFASLTTAEEILVHEANHALNAVRGRTSFAPSQMIRDPSSRMTVSEERATKAENRYRAFRGLSDGRYRRGDTGPSVPEDYNY